MRGFACFIKQRLGFMHNELTRVKKCFEVHSSFFRMIWSVLLGFCLHFPQKHLQSEEMFVINIREMLPHCVT